MNLQVWIHLGLVAGVVLACCLIVWTCEQASLSYSQRKMERQIDAILRAAEAEPFDQDKD